eukprot:Skav220053  [mRNA]  locus=scaffold2981:464207:465805:+ [translate_table: standard]
MQSAKLTFPSFRVPREKIAPPISASQFLRTVSPARSVNRENPVPAGCLRFLIRPKRRDAALWMSTTALPIFVLIPFRSDWRSSRS